MKSNELQEFLSELTDLEKATLLSIKGAIGFSLNGHNRKEKLLKKIPRQLWPNAKKILKRFKNAGIIEKKRSDTFKWTRFGRDLVKLLDGAPAGHNTYNCVFYSKGKLKPNKLGKIMGRSEDSVTRQMKELKLSIDKFRTHLFFLAFL
jgi:hypothetical protein